MNNDNRYCDIPNNDDNGYCEMRYCAMRRHFVIPQEGGGSKCKCRNQYLSLPVILYTIVATSIV